MHDEKKPFLAHLQELRKRVLISILSVIAFSALSYTFSEKIIWALAKYVKTLVFLSPEEAFLSYLKVSLFCGILLSLPVILFNILGFIRTALNRNERRLFTASLIMGLFLFIAGGVFAYYIALPVAINYLLRFSSDFVRPYISISRYISFCGFVILGFAISFETPFFIVLLSKLGILNSRVLRQRRKYAVLLIFIIAAILTPPDVVTQILLAIPLLVLYEIGIVFARISEKIT